MTFEEFQKKKKEGKLISNGSSMSFEEFKQKKADGTLLNSTKNNALPKAQTTVSTVQPSATIPENPNRNSEIENRMSELNALMKETDNKIRRPGYTEAERAELNTQYKTYKDEYYKLKNELDQKTSEIITAPAAVPTQKFESGSNINKTTGDKIANFFKVKWPSTIENAIDDIKYPLTGPSASQLLTESNLSPELLKKDAEIQLAKEDPTWRDYALVKSTKDVVEKYGMEDSNIKAISGDNTQLLKDLQRAEKTYQASPIDATVANVGAAGMGILGDVAGFANMLGADEIPVVKDLTASVINTANKLQENAQQYNVGTYGGYMGNLTQVITRMIPYFIAGTGKAVVEGGKAAKLIASTVNNPSFWISLTTIAGQKYNENMANGVNRWTATLNALTTAIPSALIEIAGGVGAKGKEAQSLLTTILEENFEEIAQGIVEKVSDKFTTKPDMKLYSTTEEAIINPKEIGEEVLYTTPATLLTGGTSRVIQNTQTAKANQEIADMRARYQTRQAMEGYKQTSPYAKYQPAQVDTNISTKDIKPRRGLPEGGKIYVDENGVAVDSRNYVAPSENNVQNDNYSPVNARQVMVNPLQQENAVKNAEAGKNVAPESPTNAFQGPSNETTLPTQKIQETVNSAKIAGMSDFDIKKATDLHKMLRSGANLKFYDSKNVPAGVDVRAVNANGFYLDGTLWINKDSKRQVEKILGHELTHHLESTKMYNDFANSILDSNLFYDYITSQGYDNVAQFKENLRQRGYNDQEMDSEMVSMFVEDNLFDSQEKIDRLARENRTLAQKILNWLSDMKTRLVGTSQEKELLRIENMYRKALEQAGNTEAMSKDAQYSIGGTKGWNNLRKTEKYDTDSIGWFKDKNGDLKFEFSDRFFKLKDGIQLYSNKSYKLGDILEHEVLFDAYPQLRKYNVEFEKLKEANGKNINLTKTILLNPETLHSNEDIEKTLLHEIQHAIQKIEGFEGGRNSRHSKLAYYQSLGEIEAADTVERFEREKVDRNYRQKVQPRSSEANPEHPQLQSYLSKRKEADIIKDEKYLSSSERRQKIRDAIDEFFGWEEVNERDTRADLQLLTQKDKQDSRLLDRGGLNNEENNNKAVEIENDETNNETLGQNNSGRRVAGKGPAFSLPENIQEAVFDEEFYDQYKYEDRSKIKESLEELEKLKSTFDDNTDFDIAFNTNAKIKALKNGNDNLYDYYIDSAKQRIEEDYKYNPEKYEEKAKQKEQKLKQQQKLEEEIKNATPHKREQYNIIQETNPAPDEYHTWIRSPKDIKTFEEVIAGEEGFGWGDFDIDDAKEALRKGTIRVYSSYPIKNGTFVSTSYQQALDYAGGEASGVHSRVVALDSVAWINGDEGQYAKVYKKPSKVSFSLPETDNQGRKLSAEQQEFFKDSKVRDEDGNLITVYHGTDKGGFNTFSGGKFGVNYYTDKKAMAESYTTANSKDNKVYSGYINIKNPLTIDVQGRKWSAIKRDFVDDSDVLKLLDEYLGNKYNVFSTTDITKAVKDSGKYDGVIFKNIYDFAYSTNEELGDVYATFNSNQFKNIDNAKPTYDADIRYSVNAKEDKTSNARALSRYAQTLQRKHKDIPEHVNLIQKEIDNGNFMHEVIRDKRSLNYAENYIKDNGFEDAVKHWDELMKRGKAVDKDELALGQTIYNLAVENKDTRLVMKMASDLVQEYTEIGRNLQSATLLRKMTPDGRLYALERSVQKINQDLMQKFDDFENIQIPEELADNLLNSETQKQMDKAVEQIQEYIASQIPATWQEKLNSWRYLAMLGNPRTHIRNIGGNVVFVPAVEVKNKIAQVGELFIPKDQRTKAILTKKDSKLLQYAENDFDNNQETIRGESKYDIKAGIQEKRQIYSTKALELARKGNFNLLEAEDKFFLKFRYKRAFAEALKAKGITIEQLRENSPETVRKVSEIRSYAINEAQKATYRDASIVASMISRGKRKLLNAANQSSGLAKLGYNVAYLGAEGIMPFTKTPINIVKRGIEYSPVGLLNGIKNAAFDVKSGKISAAQAIDQIAAGATGTAIVGLGVFLASMGLVNGGEEEKDKEQGLKQLKGYQNYSLNVGDKTYTIDWLAPSSIPLFIGVELYNSITSGDETAYLNALKNIAEPVVEMSMLQGINDTLQTMGEDDAIGNIIAKTLTNYLGQYNPTLLGQIARSFDPVRRTTYVDKNIPVPALVQKFIQQQAAKIPGVSRMLPTYKDQFGQEQFTDGVLNRMVQNFTSPGYVKDIKEGTVEKGITELYERTGETKVIPGYASKSLTYNGEKINLTAEQYDTYSKTRGDLSKKGLEGLFNDRYYKGLTDKEKVKVVEAVYDYANEMAKSKVIKGYELEANEQKIQKLQSNGLDFYKYILLKKTADADGNDYTSNEELEKAIKKYGLTRWESIIKEKTTKTKSNSLPTLSNQTKKLPTLKK